VSRLRRQRERVRGGVQGAASQPRREAGMNGDGNGRDSDNLREELNDLGRLCSVEEKNAKEKTGRNV
jgi:hypothetical protein